MDFLKHPLITKPISFLITFCFLWSNCVYADISYLATDAKVLLNRLLPEAKALETPIVFHSRLLTENITDLRTMVAKQADIKSKILGEGRLKEIDLENCYSMVFKDGTTDARAYYYFNDKGYFYRITDREAGVVNDIFYTAFLARFARPIGEPIVLNSYHIERFKVSDENSEVINICMKELYGIEALNKPERIDALVRFHNYCDRVAETWRKNLVGFQGSLTRGILRPAQDKFNPDGTARPYPGATVIGWVDRNKDRELFGRLADLKTGIGRKMDALIEKRGLGNRLMAFVPDDSFHITLYDLITEGNYRGFYPECSSFIEAQEKCRVQIEEAFRELGEIGEIQFEVRGIGALGKDGPYLLKANVYPKTPEDLDKIERIRAKIREKTGRGLPPFSGHITLGYIISEMDVETYREFVGSLEEYKDIELGSFAVSEVDFSHFPDMTTYTPLLRLNTVSGGISIEKIHIRSLPLVRQLGGTRLFILGIGSVWFGRQWPPNNDSYRQPDEAEITRYLDEVFERVGAEGFKIMIDTAAAYGSSEERIGNYFRDRSSMLSKAFIATKWGENFDIATGQSTLDFSRDNLVVSVDRSIARLGKVDLLYVHCGTSADVLRDREVIAEMRRMREQGYGGIQYIGVSISTGNLLETAVRENLIDGFDVIQMPVSLFLKRRDLIEEIQRRGISIILNSPIRKSKDGAPAEIYDRLLQHGEISVVLTGTRSHLVETIGYVKDMGEQLAEKHPTPGTKSHPAGVGEEGEEDPLARELADKYPTLAGNADALDNYRFLKKTLGDRLDEAIQTAASAVGVTPELVVSGVMGQDLARINGGREFMERLSRRDPRKGFAGIISSGGGGPFSSNMVHEIRDLDPDEKARIMRAVTQDELEEKGHYVSKNLVAVIDDGGRTGKVLRKLFDIPEWGIFVVPWGDLISVTIWGTSDDVITLVYRGSNCFSKININTAGEELIRETIKESFASFEKIKQGICERLARHIVSNRPTEGYNETAINRLITDYLAGEISLSEKDIKGVKTFVKERIKYSGEHEVTLADLMKGTRMRRVFFELGKSFKKKELRLSPGFWFYVTNILNMSRRYDEDFVETGITPLEGISSLNAVQQGAYELSCLYEKGKAGGRATVHPERGLQMLNAAIGSEDVYSTPISYDQATLCGILEAASFRISKVIDGKTINDTYVIGEDERHDKAYIRQIRYLDLEGLPLPITEHLVKEGSQSITKNRHLRIHTQNTGIDIRIIRARPEAKTEAYIEGRLVRVGHRFIIEFGTKQIILAEVEGEEAKTAVIVNGEIKIIRTDATWQPVEIEIAPGVTLSFKSRLIITQDWVTGNNVDEPHPSPIHYITYKRRIAAINPNTATKEQLKFYLSIDDSLADAIIAYRTAHPFEKVSDLMDVSGIDRDSYNRIQKYVILGKEGQQSYDRYEDIPEEEWPKADDTALEIAKQGHVFFTPKGSLFTSLACNMLYPDFVRALVARPDLTRVFMGKYKRDIEAAGLTLSEQFKAFLRSIQRVKRDVLKDGDRLYRYIFIPRVADNIRDQIIRDRTKEAKEIREKKVKGDPSAKVSKVPTDVQLVVVNINNADKTALMLLPHITERLAELIIGYRDTHGRFKSKNEIENIPEIRSLGNDLLETIKENIILKGEDDLEYFRKQGMIPVIIYNEKKEGYDELQVLDLLAFTGERDTLLSLLSPAKRAEVEGREQVFEFRNGDSFWPVTWWDSIFGLTVGEEITVTLDNRYSFTLNIPADLDESRMYIVAQYLANYIYNRVKAVGSKNVNLSCDRILFEKVKAILDNNFNFGRQGFTITNNIGEETRERIEADSVFLDVGKSEIGLTYRDREGSAVRTAPSDMVIDMALQAARHGETGVHGAVNQYITQDGVARIARRILPGNLRNSDVEEDLNKVVLEVLSEFLDKEGKLKDVGLTPKEFFSIIDLQDDTGVQLLRTHNELASRIVDKTAEEFISKVKDYYKDFRMNTLLLPSSKMCLGRVLDRRLGEVLTARLDGMPIDICLEDELSYDMVYRKFLSDDPAAVEVFKVLARYLAVTLEELHNILGIKRISISGIPYDNSPGGDFIVGEAAGILRQKGLDIEITRGQGEVSPEVDSVNTIRSLVNSNMPLSAVYALSHISKTSPYFRYAVNIIGSVYTQDVILELLDKINGLKQLISRQELESFEEFMKRIDNTLVNPERISWFMDDLLADIKAGLSLEKAMENSQRRLFVGPQEMWAYLLPIRDIAGDRPVIFVARNEELQNAWTDLLRITGGKDRSHLVKLSRKESLGSQINSVLNAIELAAPVTGRFWKRLKAVYRSLSLEERRLIDSRLKNRGVGMGWNGLKGMSRGKIVGILADIGIDENVQLYWDNYREARNLKHKFRFALELNKLEQVRETASGWKIRNEMLLRHLKSLSSSYSVEVPELDKLSSLVSDFSGLVERGEDFSAIERIGSEIYSVWLRNVNLVFNSIPAERLRHIARPLLNVLLEDTDFCKEVKDGVVFADDIVTGGRTMLLSKFFIQAFRKGVNSEFIPIVKRNKIPEGHHYYVTQLARLPEDCPDISSVVYYEERDISGDIPVLAQITLDRLLARDCVIPADKELSRYEEVLGEEVVAVKSQLPDITLSDRIIKQVIKNCLTGIPERDLKSVYGLMIENYYNPSPVQYARRKQYRYEVGEIYRLYSNRLSQIKGEDRGRELIQLAQKIKPYEESRIVHGWKKLSEIYRTKQSEVVTKAEGLRDSIDSLLGRYSELRERTIDFGTQIRDLSPAEIAQDNGFFELIRLHRDISVDFTQLVNLARGQLDILNTRLMDTPDVLPEGGFASESDIKRVLNTFGIEDVSGLTIVDMEELIREYNKALALMQLYLNQGSAQELKAVCSKIRSLLVPPRVARLPKVNLIDGYLLFDIDDTIAKGGIIPPDMRLAIIDSLRKGVKVAIVTGQMGFEKVRQKVIEAKEGHPIVYPIPEELFGSLTFYTHEGTQKYIYRDSRWICDTSYLTLPDGRTVMDLISIVEAPARVLLAQLYDNGGDGGMRYLEGKYDEVLRLLKEEMRSLELLETRTKVQTDRLELLKGAIPDLENNKLTYAREIIRAIKEKEGSIPDTAGDRWGGYVTNPRVHRLNEGTLLRIKYRFFRGGDPVNERRGWYAKVLLSKVLEKHLRENRCLLEGLSLSMVGTTSVRVMPDIGNKGSAVIDFTKGDLSKAIFIGDRFGLTGNDRPAIYNEGLAIVSVGPEEKCPDNVLWIGKGIDRTYRLLRMILGRYILEGGLNLKNVAELIRGKDVSRLGIDKEYPVSIDQLIEMIIDQGRFQWDRDELRQYYIPLSQKIIRNQRETGKRYVVGVSGPGGVGKTEFTEKLKVVLEIMLGRGKVGIFEQGSFLGESRFVEEVRARLTREGRGFSKSRAAPRYLNLPYMLGQIRSFRDTGRYEHPVIERDREAHIRTQTGLEQREAEEILLVEGHYLFVNDAYNEKYISDDEWAGYFRGLYSEIDLHLFMDADIGIIKQWRDERSARRGIRTELGERETIKVQKVKMDRKNADIIIEKGEGHRIKEMVEPVKPGSKSHPAGKEEIENLADQIISRSGFDWDSEQLKEYYIPLALEIIARQEESGERYVVGISGPGGVGKGDFAIRLGFIIKEILGEGSTDIMSQDEYFYELREVEDIKQRLRGRGDTVTPENKGAPRYLDVPNMLEQIQSFKVRGSFREPILRRTTNVRERTGFNDKRADKILIVEGLYLLTENLYNSKFTPDDEWAGHFRRLYRAMDVHLYIDADLESIKRWKIEREARGRTLEVMEQRWRDAYREHALKAKMDRDNADIVVEKGTGHVVKRIIWDEDYEKGRIRERFGSLPELKRSIHIVGPARSGKTTVARFVSERLRCVIFNTGDIFRPYTYMAITTFVWLREIQPVGEIILSKMGNRIMLGTADITDRFTKELLELIERTSVEYEIPDHGEVTVKVDGTDITSHLHDPIVDANVDVVSKVGFEIEKSVPDRSCRAQMKRKARSVKQGIKGLPLIITTGRGFKGDSIYRLFLNATLPVRARRACIESGKKSYGDDLKEMHRSIQRRDEADRIFTLLNNYSGVYDMFDSTNLIIDQQNNEVFRKVETALKRYEDERKGQEEILSSIIEDRKQNKEGTVSFLLLKGGERGGVNAEVRDKLASLLRDDFEISIGTQKVEDLERVFMRWKVALERFIKNLHEETDIEKDKIASLRDAISDNDPWKFERVLLGIQRDLARKGVLIRRIQRLVILFKYIKDNETQLVILKRKRSRRDILASKRISTEFARELLGGRDPFSVDEQDFVKNIIVGPTNAYKALPGMLRHVIYKELIRVDGLLRNVLAEGRAVGLDDKMVISICNGIHAPGTEELGLEIGLIELSDCGVVLDFIESKKVMPPSSSPVPDRRSVQGPEIDRYYEVRPNLPLKTFSIEEIQDLIKREADRLASGLDMDTFDGAMQYWLLKKRLDFMLRNICAVAQTMSEEEGFNFYNTLMAIMYLIPYIAEQIPQDEYTNIYLARDSGVLYMAYSLANRLLGRDGRNNHVFHLSRKNMGRKIYSQMRKIVKSANLRKPDNIKDYMDIVMPDFIGLMKEDSEFRKRALRIYQQLRNSGIVTDSGNRFRVVDTWTGGRLSTYLMAVIRFFNEYDIDTEGNLKEKETKSDCDFSQFIVRPKDKTMFKYSQVFDFQRTGLTQEMVENWYMNSGYECKFASEEVFRRFMEEVSIQVVTRHYPYGELNLGHRIDWDPLKQRLTHSSAAKQLGALLREVMVINSVLDFLRHRGEELKPDTRSKKAHIEKGLDPNIAANNFLKFIGIQLTPEEDELYERLVFIYSEHYVTESDANQINILVNTAYLVKLLGPEAVRFIIETQNAGLDYHLAVQQLIDSVKRIDYHYFVSVIRSILLVEGSKEKGVELLKKNPRVIAVLLNETALVYHSEPPLKDEFLIKAHTQTGLRDIIENSELDELIGASGTRRKKEINRAVKEIGDLPRRSVVLWTGPSGSGKTTVARETISYLRAKNRSVLNFNLDNYYKRTGLPRTPSGAVNLDTPEAIDWDLVKLHIRRLLEGESVNILKSRGKTPKFEVAKLEDILYIDGLFANSGELIAIFEELGIPYLTVAVDCVPYFQLDNERNLTSWDIRALRRIDRDINRRPLDKILRRLAIVKEEERRYVLPSLSQADLFINTYEPFDLCFLRNSLLAKLDTSDESVREEAERLRSILSSIPEINPNVSKWREQLEDAKRLMIKVREDGLEGAFELAEFYKMTALIKDALFYNYHDEELFSLLKEGIRSQNQHLRIICAYVLVDIGDKELVTIQERYEYLGILLSAVRSGILPRDDSLQDRIDFHVHSYYSDGLRSVAGLVFEAWHKGMRAIAITDHNTFGHMEEVAEIREIIRNIDPGFEVIPGMEINVSDPDYGSGSEHILVYFPIDSRIRGRENYGNFLTWLKRVGTNPHVMEIEKYNLWDFNTFTYRLNQLRDVQEGDEEGIGIIPRFLDLKEPDFVRLSPHKKFRALVSYALHRKYGLPMQVINEAMENLAFDKKDIFGNEELKARGYSGARIGDTLEFLKSIGGVVVVAHPKYLVLKKQDTVGADKATSEGKAARIRLKMDKLGALFTRYREYLDGIEVHYPEHTDDLLAAIMSFINEQNRTRKEGEKIITTWGSDFHYRPGDMETGKVIRQTRLGIGFDEGRKGHILRSIGTNYYTVERIIERAVEKSSTPLGAKRHPTAAGRETTSNGYLAEYEGIAYLNGAFSTEPSVSEKVRGLNLVLNSALELIQDVAPRRGPPIYVHVKPRHSANVTKDIDVQGRVHLVFDERFIKYFVDPSVIQAYPEDISRILPQVAQWIIAERVGHELSHDNRIGTPEKEREEEKSVIKGFDIPFYRRLLENPRLKGEIDMFFRVVRPVFKSGHFYGGPGKGFLGDVAGLEGDELDDAIEGYIDTYYSFGRTAAKKGHPTTVEEIDRMLRQSTDFRSIAGLSDRFRNLQEFREIKIVFDCGNSIIREYTIQIPHEITDEVIDYIALFIYNRLGVIGARKVFIDDDEIRRAVDERYDIDDKTRPRYRGLLKMRKNLRHIYGVEFEFVSTRPEGTTVIEKEPFSYNKDSGEVIGVDIGKSDIKVVAMREGRVTYYYKEDWDPEKFDKADQHIGVIKGFIDKAIREGGISRLDAIGVSVNLVVIDGMVVGSGPMNAGLKDRAEKQRIKELRKEIEGIYNVPVGILNDGKASSLWANESMGLVNVLGLSLGSGLASGYADKNGDVIDIHGEMGNVVIDIGPDAVGHSVTNMPGASQQYLSQRAVFRLAERKGINLEGIQDNAAKLRHVQYLFDDGTDEQRQKIKEIYVELGRYLAAAIAEVSQYLKIENVVLFGRVTIGEGGGIIKTAAEIVLREDYPDIDVRIQLPLEPPEDKPRDFYREFAQAIGVSYFANKERQRGKTVEVPPGEKSHPAGREKDMLEAFQLDEEGRLTVIGEAKGYRDILQGALDRLTKEYDLGLYAVTDQIEVVRNLQAALQGQGRPPLATYVTEDGVRKIKIDEVVFKSPLSVYEELKQEFLKSIVRLIPGSNPATSSVVSTLQYVRGFLKASTEEQDEFLRLLRETPLLDPDGEYQRLLGRLRMIKGVTDKEIIASVVRCALRSSVYAGIYDQLGLDRELAAKVRDLDVRLDDALQVFTEIMRARQGEELVRQIEETEEISLAVVKTFNGVRIQGLEKLGKRLAGIIAASVKVASKLGTLVTRLQKVKTQEQFCIVLDRNRIPEEMRTKWDEEIERLKTYKTTDDKQLFEIAYSLEEAQQKGYRETNIIHLVDPGDLQDQMPEGILYLPLPYLRSSLYIAAMVVIAGGKVDNVDPLVMDLIFSLYPGLKELTSLEQGLLFTRPWSEIILPHMRSVIEEINNLRRALVQIEKAA